VSDGYLLGVITDSSDGQMGAYAPPNLYQDGLVSVKRTLMSGIVDPIVDRRPSPPEVITDITTF
jgi:hypothetical protein